MPAGRVIYNLTSSKGLVDGKWRAWKGGELGSTKTTTGAAAASAYIRGVGAGNWAVRVECLSVVRGRGEVGEVCVCSLFVWRGGGGRRG